MKISGFTFVRNGQMLGYPFIQSIQSILPLVDEFVIAVGESEDDTLAMIQAIRSPKIRVIETIWNEHMTARGFVYGQQKMIAQYACTGDWLFYLEADELVHEDDLNPIRESMKKHLNDPGVEALAFDYIHFYGNKNTHLNSPAWYRREARVIKASVRSYAPDGLFWVVLDKQNRQGRYPTGVMTGAKIYHYGWVRSEQQMDRKFGQVTKYWNGEHTKNVNYANVDPAVLQLFKGKHPALIEDYFPDAGGILQANPQYKLSSRDKKYRLKLLLEQILGRDLSKKHFTLINP